MIKREREKNLHFVLLCVAAAVVLAFSVIFALCLAGAETGRYILPLSAVFVSGIVSAATLLAIGFFFLIRLLKNASR